MAHEAWPNALNAQFFYSKLGFFPWEFFPQPYTNRFCVKKCCKSKLLDEIFHAMPQKGVGDTCINQTTRPCKRQNKQKQKLSFNSKNSLSYFKSTL